MSFVLKLDPKRRIVGRLIGRVHNELVKAALRARKDERLTQAGLAAKLGVDRSRVNRILKGDENITLRSIAEFAWALGYDVDFIFRKKVRVGEPAPIPGTTRSTSSAPVRQSAGDWGSAATAPIVSPGKSILTAMAS